MLNSLENHNLDNKKISLWPAIFFCLIQLCTITDNSALMNASSAIALTFKANATELQAANIMYPLMAGAIMIAGGFLGNILGWKHLLQYGLIILSAGELLTVISPNIIIFVYGARVLVGIGASLSIPAILGIVTIMYEKKQQAIVFGLIAATIALSSSIAPLASGFIIVYLNWQSVYILLIILFVVSFIYISICVHNDKVSDTKKTFDFIGFILVFLGLCFLIIGLMSIVKWGIIKPLSAPFTIFGYSPCLIFIVTGIVLLGLLIKWEQILERKKGTGFVLIPKEFMTNRQTLSAILMNAFVFLVMGGAVFLIIIFLQIFYNTNAIITGCIMLIFAVGMVPFSILTPQFGGNFSPRSICIVGIIISSLGCMTVGFGITVLHGIGILFYLGMLFLGIGSGLVASQANFIVAASIKDKKLASQSSGLQGAMRNIGTAISIAILSTIFFTTFTFGVKSRLAGSEVINSEFKQKVEQIKEIPTSNRKIVIEVLKSKYRLSQKEINAFLDLYWRSSITAFRSANVVLGIILLLFLFLAKDIISEKLKYIQKPKEKL